MQQEDEPENNEGLYLDVLQVFIDQYEPGNKATVSDYFSSSEINSLILSHTGVEIGLTELHKLMQQMGYEYELQHREFVWLCVRKRQVLLSF